jgi:hypothetical protein
MKSSKLGLIATVAILFTPVAAFAQDAQTSVQSNSNSAAAIGTGNVILQDANQVSDQTQVGIDGYGYGYDAPDAQLSIQGNSNEAAAVGHGNAVVQGADQYNTQTQVDVGSYLPY